MPPTFVVRTPVRTCQNSPSIVEGVAEGRGKYKKYKYLGREKTIIHNS